MADKYLEVIGYTEHGLRHTDIVSNTAYNSILKNFRSAKVKQSTGCGSEVLRHR